MEVYKVWALPYSLATTNGIIGYFLFLEVLRCFSSPGSLYLSYIFKQEWLDMTLDGFPHSEIFGSKLVWQLPEAYRSLLRPSSVSCVKASFTCAWVTFYDWFKMTKCHIKFSSLCNWLVIGWNHWFLNNRCRLSFLSSAFIQTTRKFTYPKFLSCETQCQPPLVIWLEFTLWNFW